MDVFNGPNESINDPARPRRVRYYDFEERAIGRRREHAGPLTSGAWPAAGKQVRCESPASGNQPRSCASAQPRLRMVRMVASPRKNSPRRHFAAQVISRAEAASAE